MIEQAEMFDAKDLDEEEWTVKVYLTGPENHRARHPKIFVDKKTREIRIRWEKP